MSVVQRRIFYGKVGTADQLVQWARDMYAVLRDNGLALDHRILADHQSGRTDRVVVEFEVESLAELESGLDKVMENDAARAKFGEVFSRLPSLIDHAEVEHWAVQ